MKLNHYEESCIALGRLGLSCRDVEDVFKISNRFYRAGVRQCNRNSKDPEATRSRQFAILRKLAPIFASDATIESNDGLTIHVEIGRLRIVLPQGAR